MYLPLPLPTILAGSRVKSVEEMQRKLAEEIDCRLFATLCGTANVTARSLEPVTLDTIRRAMLKMPPRETWLSSKLFPADKAITVEGANERFTCAHPGFWLRAEDALRMSDQVNHRPSTTTNSLGFELRPVEIDPCEDETPERAEWRFGHWTRLAEAFEVAMIPLPEWLRASPKFGKHG